MTTPTLVIVSGPAGSGKTTLAHELARSLACPAVCRDEIKEGMVHAAGAFDPATGDVLTPRTLPVFFEVIRLLLESRVTVVAEAAFQDKVWNPNLEAVKQRANLRIVQCHTDPVTGRNRIIERAESRTAHADAALLEVLAAGDRYFDEFERVAIAAPSIDVDTTAGYEPTIEQIVAFVNGVDRQR